MLQLNIKNERVIIETIQHLLVTPARLHGEQQDAPQQTVGF